MNKTKTNIPSSIADDARFHERFQYWIGYSARRYIFSIYAPKACPPLPGAIYLAVCRQTDGSRTARAIGRFPKFWDAGHGHAIKIAREAGADEIHVHLLTESEVEAEYAVGDLKAALTPAVRMRELRMPARARQRPSRVSAAGTLSRASEQIDMFSGSGDARGRASV